MSEPTKQAKKKKVTYVAFAREQGVQIKIPNGAFVKYAQENKLASNSSCFHIIGVEDIQVNQVGLVFLLTDGQERHFPYAQIASFSVE